MFVHTHVHVRALMMQKSCAVGTCNVTLRNHLKGKTAKILWDLILTSYTINSICYIVAVQQINF